MPTYDYLCRSCGHRFEKFQNIMAEPIRECPLCKSRNVTRLLTGGAGLIFKGSGFYETDYKNSHSSPAAPKDEKKKDSKNESKKEN